MVSSYFLILSALAFMAAAAYIEYVRPRLRDLPISVGLAGPHHWVLDASYLALTAALVNRASEIGGMPFAASVGVGLGLLGSAVTNTWADWVDAETGGLHSTLHAAFTGLIFAGALTFQLTLDHGWLWWLTALNLLAPGVVWLIRRDNASPEKAAVAILCIWLIIWSV